MTKKDFELIAKMISSLDDGHHQAFLHAFADALEKDNKRFNREKFIKASTRKASAQYA